MGVARRPANIVQKTRRGNLFYTKLSDIVRTIHIGTQFSRFTVE